MKVPSYRFILPVLVVVIVSGVVFSRTTGWIEVVNADELSSEPYDDSNTEPLDMSKAEPLDMSKAEPIDMTKAEPIDMSKAEPIDLSNAEPLDFSNAVVIALDDWKDESFHLSQATPIDRYLMENELTLEQLLLSVDQNHLGNKTTREVHDFYSTWSDDKSCTFNEATAGSYQEVLDRCNYKTAKSYKHQRVVLSDGDFIILEPESACVPCPERG